MQTDIRHNGCHVSFADQYTEAFSVSLHGTSEVKFGTAKEAFGSWVNIRAENDQGTKLEIGLFGKQAVQQFESLADDRLNKISDLADRMQDLAFQQRGEHEQRSTPAGDDLAEMFNEFLTAFEQINLLCDGEGTDE